MEKIRKLKAHYNNREKIAIGLSGGSDSITLLHLLTEVKDKKLIYPVIFDFPFMISDGRINAIDYCNNYSLKYELIKINWDAMPKEIIANDESRCYHCKMTMFLAIKNFTNKNGIKTVVDGSNEDDKHQYRPGRKALEELGIISPFATFCVTKKEILQYATKVKLDKWILPSNSCYATRIQDNLQVEKSNIHAVQKVEEFLAKLGFRYFRARFNNFVFIIEIDENEFQLVDENIKLQVQGLISSHFKNVTCDIVDKDFSKYKTL